MQAMRLAFYSLAALWLGAADWPQWRGPQRNGIAGDPGALPWPKQLTVKWRTPVGEGFSTPVADASGIYVFTRDQESESVQAFDAATGRQRWRKTYPAAFTKNKYATEMGKGPHSTPVLYQGRLTTLGIAGVLSCWNAASGELVWRKDFSKSIDFTNLFTATAMSPLIDGGLLYVQIGDDRGGQMLALDPATGSGKWSWKGDGPSYSSPVVAGIDGVRQLLALTNKHAIGLDAASGKLLWQTDFTDQWLENIVTPVVQGNRVILAGVRRPAFALEVSRSGVRTLWQQPEVTMYMSSPVLDGDTLYGMTAKRKGQLFALDARSGKLLWTTTGREGTNVSLVSAGPYLLALNDSGDLKVIRRNPAKYEEVAVYKVSESATWAQPVLLGRQLLIKDSTSLTSYSF